MRTPTFPTCLLAAALALALAAPGSAVPLVQVDINDNDDTPGDLQPGFTSLLETDTAAGDSYSKSIGAILVDIDGVVSGLDDRHRATPVDGGGLTQSALYRDFVFASSSAASSGNGLDLHVSGLTPNQKYDLTFWVFDSGSSGNRVSDWFVNGVFTYTFNGGIPPTDDADNRFTLTGMADALGDLTVRALANPGGSSGPNVFLNAFQIDAPPVPEPVTASLGLVGVLGLAWVMRRRTA